ncbi:MAG TPA: DUF4259 domain-containing protein [Gemmatimonadaceae bacterium]|nr:DUF4259 domain-containing protein [Gemmatimonadaceae bacterium]
MRERLAKKPYFRATAAWWGPDGLRDPDVPMRAVAAAWPTIEALFAATTECRVYGEEQLRVYRRRPATTHTEWPAWATSRHPRAPWLDVRCDEASRNPEFLSVALVRGVVLAIALDPDRLVIDDVLPRLADPTQVTPPLGITPRPAQRAVKRTIRDSPLVALVMRNAYGLDVELHGEPGLIGELFDRTLTIGRWTEGFEKGNCRYDVRPFEVGSTLLWEAVSRKRHGLEVAIEYLEKAERDPDAEELTTPDAMAAAELLAALAGKPPGVYTELEPDLDWRIAKWVEEKRASFSVAREHLALARRALEAIVERSTFPDRWWRTLPPKAKWERVMHELFERLTDAERQSTSPRP